MNSLLLFNYWMYTELPELLISIFYPRDENTLSLIAETPSDTPYQKEQRLEDFVTNNGCSFTVVMRKASKLLLVPTHYLR